MKGFLMNLVAGVDSEYLLLFYTIAIGALILACFKSVRLADRTRHMEPPEISGRLDPYELAFLRGGEKEVTRLAIRSLLQRGLLKITESRDWNSTATTIIREVDRGRKAESGELAPIEACIMKWTGFPALPRQIYEPGGIPDLLRGMCGAYQDNLADRELLAPPGMKGIGAGLWWIGSVLIFLVGGYLMAVVLARGETLVAVILIPMAVVGVIALAFACLRFPRISHRGRAYLQHLELAYDSLTRKGPRPGHSRSASTSAGGLDDREPSRDFSVYFDRLLMDGIFGEVSPADTPLTALEATLVNHLIEEDTTVESAAAIWERGKIGRSG